MYAFSVIPRSELTYPQDLDALVRFGIGYYPDYYNNRRIRHKLNGLIPAQHRSQAILAAQYSICTRFSKSSVRLFWCPFGSRGRVKALVRFEKLGLDEIFCQVRGAAFAFALELVVALPDHSAIFVRAVSDL